MKKAVNAWFFPKDMHYVECMKKAKAAGFDGIELNVDETGNLTLATDEKALHLLAKQSEDIGIAISSVSTSLAWGAPVTSNDKAKKEKGIATIKKELEAAAILGADTILVIPGVVDEEVSYDVAYDRALEMMSVMAKEAEKMQINIGLENVWNKFLLSPLEMRGLIDEINSPYVGSYFDAGNVLINGYPEQWINILGERIKKVHIKDYKLGMIPHEGFVGLHEGEVNFARVIKALKAVGYDSYLTAEVFISGGDIDAEVRKLADDMDKVIASGQ